MKFAETWLREWVNPKLDAEELGQQLTMAGHEVNSIESQGSELKGVVIAEVVDVARHPNADRLSVCQVSTGKGKPVEVVCGAPNVVAGMKSPLASPAICVEKKSRSPALTACGSWPAGAPTPSAIIVVFFVLPPFFNATSAISGSQPRIPIPI